MNQRKIGIVLSYIYTAVHIFVNLLYVPLLLNKIGHTEYGLYQLVGSLMSYLNITESFFSAGLLRYYCKYNSLGNEEKKENILAISRRIYFFLSVIVILVGIACVFVFNAVYKSSLTEHELSEATFMLLIFVATIVVNLTNSVYTAAINANERFIFAKMLSIITTVLQPVTILFIVQKVPYAISVVIIQFGMCIVSAVARQYYSAKVLKIKIKYHYKDNIFVKNLFSLSFSVLLVMIADQIFWKADQLIIGKVIGTSAVAIYAVGAQIYLNYSPIGTSIASVFMPRLSNLLDRENNMLETSRLFIKVGRISFLLLAAVLLGFGLFGKDFILIWAGEGFTEAYYIALIIMIPLTVDVMQNMGLAILQIKGKYGFRGKIYLSIAIINIVATVYLVKYFGIVGAAVSTSISIAIGNGVIMNIYYAKKINLDIKGFWNEILSIFPGVFISFLCGILIKQIQISNLFIKFCIQIILFCIAYLLIVYKISLNEYERGLIKKILLVFKK